MAFSDLIEKMRAGGPGTSEGLESELWRFPKGEVVEAVLPLVEDSDASVSIFAIRALGWASTAAARARLVELFDNDLVGSYVKGLAAEALASAGDASVLPALRRLASRIGEPVDATSAHPVGTPEALLQEANESFDFEPVLLALRLSRAWARCGDHSLAYLPIFFTSYQPTPEDQPDVRMLREFATDALTYAVGDGMIRALLTATTDEWSVVHRNALNALFYLGTLDAITEMVRRSGDADVGLASIARARFHDLTGAPYFDRGDDVATWWNANEAAFKPGICFRLGKPLTLQAVLQEMPKEPHRCRDYVTEVNILAGTSWTGAPEPAPTLPEAATSSVGQLLKAGRVLELPQS